MGSLRAVLRRLNLAKANTMQYGIVCIVVFVGFYLVQTIATYFGGRLKKVMEQEMIESKLKEMEQKELEK